jgi:uncharacterized protein involved in exopolysaccharide biosynthesis
MAEIPPRSYAPEAGRPVSARGALTPIEAANVVLRHWRLVLLVPLGLAFLVGLWGLLKPRDYSSSASFMPNQESSTASSLAGIAAQFGVNIGGGGAGNSPQFYADLLTSHDLLRATVLTPFGAQGLDLVRTWDVSGSDSARKVERAITLLGRRLTVDVRAETGVIALTATTRHADLSERIVSRMIDLVNAFNLNTRQSQAAAQRRFIEEQLKVSRGQLLQAEDSLQAFLEHNRSYQSSPQLQFEESRLQRHVDLRQQVYTSLSQSYEQARIDEVRSTPVITVVSPAELPARPDRRHLFLKVTIALVLGGILGLVLAFGAEYVRRARQLEPGDFAEFGALWRSVVRDLGGLAERIRQRGSRDA